MPFNNAPVTYESGVGFMANGVPVSDDTGGGGGGASAFTDLTDKASADLPAVNTPLATALGTKADAAATATALAGKQPTLVSATNIKTVNGSSILGAGDLAVAAASTYASLTDKASVDLPTVNTPLTTALAAKADKTTPVVLVNGDFTADVLSLTGTHLNRFVISDKTTLGTVKLPTDATSGLSANDTAFMLYARGADIIVTSDTGATLTDASGAASTGVRVRKGTSVTFMRSTADLWTQQDVPNASKFAFAASGPTLHGYKMGNVTPTSFGTAADNPLDTCTLGTGTSTADGAVPYNMLPRGRFTGGGTTSRAAGYVAGDKMAKRGDGAYGIAAGFPLVVSGSIADANPTEGYIYMGLLTGAGSFVAATQPSAQTVQGVFLGMDHGESTMRIWARGSAGNSTRFDLGANFPRAQFNMFYLSVWESSDGATIYAQAFNHQTQAVSSVYSFSGTTAPTAGSVLYQFAARGSAGETTATTPALDVGIRCTGRWGNGHIGS